MAVDFFQKSAFLGRAIAQAVCVFWIAGCEPSSLSELRCEGEAQTKKLAEELRGIQTQEELRRAVPVLRKRFLKIADLLVQARRFAQEPVEPSLASEQLFVELARLYEIPGGRELVESAQVEAVERWIRFNSE